MGLNLSPEVFQKKMTELLSGLKGVDVIMDDVLVYGHDRSEHDSNLETMLDRIEQSGLELNKERQCVFSQSKTEYFGHIVSEKGISPNPKKVEAVTRLEPPKDKKELQRVIGLVNYLGRFVENLSTIISPLTDLLKQNVVCQ